jgi:Asp-tRNA(Asn)/Glu-tRNA(Gln) amidotransferase A subunit family amidase
LIVEGRSISEAEYLQARRRTSSTVEPINEALRENELAALITPATIGTACEPSTTGDPAFNSPWSYTGRPTVSFPTGLASDGLPVAVQLTGLLANDAALIDAAEWCEQAIRSRRH